MAQLFEVKSDHGEGAEPIPPGATMHVIHCVLRDCRPMNLTLSREICRSFAVLQVHAARQPLPIKWNEQRDRLTWADSPYPRLVAGQDFYVTVRNDSDEPAHFRCDVRGSKLG